MLTEGGHAFQDQLNSMSEKPMIDQFLSDLDKSVPGRLIRC